MPVPGTVLRLLWLPLEVALCEEGELEPATFSIQAPSEWQEPGVM